jgi:hypothetical protein
MSDLTSDTTAPRQRNVVVMVGLAVVVLGALAFGAYAFLGGDGDADVSVTATDEVATAASEPDPAPDAVAAGIEALPVVTYDVFLSRDPFDPVVPEPVASTSETEGTAVQVIDDRDPVDGSGELDDRDGFDEPGENDRGDGETTDGWVTDECRGGTEEVVCAGHVLSLLSLTIGAETTAVVQVDTETYEVARGEVFADRFLFLDVVDERTARMLYGDQVFRISIGERVMK